MIKLLIIPGLLLSMGCTEANTSNRIYADDLHEYWDGANWVFEFTPKTAPNYFCIRANNNYEFVCYPRIEKQITL